MLESSASPVNILDFILNLKKKRKNGKVLNKQQYDFAPVHVTSLWIDCYQETKPESKATSQERNDNGFDRVLVENGKIQMVLTDVQIKSQQSLANDWIDGEERDSNQG